ncbi:MAG: hypothetical protein IJF19_03495 [Clostridia bacterium]|nr:hypothetical protein [Clostridia bacterium]
MKRIFAFTLLLCMVFSLCTLTACGGDKPSKAEENIYADFEEFDSYVPKGSDIIGTWKMTSPSTDREWQFFANTTLHMTKTVDGVSMTDVCTYNYDGEGNLSAYIFNDGKAHSYTVMIEDKVLTITDSEGVKSTFVKVK